MIRFAENTPDPTSSEPLAPTLKHPDTDQLADEIAELAAQIHAATYRLLVLIAEFDRRQDFGWGFKSCAHWLSWRTSIGIGTAREHVRVARALPDLPLISEGMKSAELSYSKVRAITRVATAANESDLLTFARHGTASHVERLVRAWRRVDRNEEAALERARHESRSLTVYPDEDGSWVVRGRLDPEVGALLRKALEAAGDELYRASQESGASGDKTPSTAPAIPEDRPSHGQRMADAIGLVAERALASEGRVRRADRFQVVLHVDEAALVNPEHTEPAADAEHRPGTGHQPDTGHSVLEESGYRVPAGTSRSCRATPRSCR